MTAANPQANGFHSNGATKQRDPFAAFRKELQPRMTDTQYLDFKLSVQNTALSSRQWVNDVMDPRRSVDDECGYPDSGSSITLETYRQLYDRECIATRVVQVMPKECWQQSPTVYEEDDPDKVTPFEEAWDELEVSAQAQQSWHQDEVGGTVWEYLFRADMLSGIGHFGVLLLGFDDGKNLAEPVEGVVTINWKRVPVMSEVTVNVMTPDGKFVKGKQRKQIGTRMVRRTDSPFRKVLTPDSPMTNAERAALQKILDNPTITTKQTINGDKKATTETHQLNYLNSPFVQERSVENKQDRGQMGFGTKDGHAPSSEARTSSGTDPMSTAGASFGGQLGSLGTDQQYFGVQFGPGESLSDKPAKEGMKLMFMRPYDESLVQIVRYEWNVRSPRFGLPTMYRITLNDPREQHSGIGLPLATVFVHWSRVIHLADNLGNSEIFGVPRMRPVLNRLLDLRKIYGADGELFWKNAAMRIFFETIPQLGGDVDIDVNALKDGMENMENGLQRWMALMGMSAKSIAPSVVDPTAHINVHLEAISIQLGIPMRVFKGSERGELASSQDDAAWNDRLRHRQHTYLTPRVICPLVDRLISVGVLPEPEGYTVEWPDLDSTTQSDKATIGGTMTTALAAYVQGGCEAMIPPEEFYIHFLGLKDEVAKSIVEAAKKAHEEADLMTLPPPGDPGHPASESPPPPPPSPMTVAPGASLAHPETGKIMSTAPGKPAPVVASPAGPKQPFGGPKAPTGQPPKAPTGNTVGNFQAAGDVLKSEVMPGYGQIWFHEASGTAWYVGGDGDEPEFEDKVKDVLMDLREVEEVTYASEYAPRKKPGWVKVYDPQKSKTLPVSNRLLQLLENSYDDKDGGRFITLKGGNVVHIGEGESVKEAIGKHFERVSKAAGHKVGEGDSHEKEHDTHDKHEHDDHGHGGHEHGPEHALEHLAHDIHHAHEAHEAGEAIHETLSDLLGDKKSSGAAVDAAGAGVKAAHGAVKEHVKEHAIEALHGAASDHAHDAAHDAASTAAGHGAEHAGGHEGHGGGIAGVGANIAGMVAAKLYPHAMKAVTDFMARSGPRGERAAKAIVALHEGASKIAEAATKKLQERYGKATTAAILGAGALVATSGLHAIGVPGPATKLVPFKGLLGAMPFVAMAEAGRQLGIIHKDSHVEKKLMVAATWIHGIRGAVESRLGKVKDAAVGKIKQAVGKKVTGNRTTHEDWVMNSHPDDDEVTLSPEELKAAAKEFNDSLAKEFAKLAKQHEDAFDEDETPTVSNRLQQLLEERE